MKREKKGRKRKGVSCSRTGRGRFRQGGNFILFSRVGGKGKEGRDLVGRLACGRGGGGSWYGSGCRKEVGVDKWPCTVGYAAAAWGWGRDESYIVGGLLLGGGG